MPGPKLTKEEREQAIQDIVDLLVIGARSRQITSTLDNKYGITRRTVQRYMNKALEEFEKIKEGFQSQALGQSLAKLNFLYSRLIQDKDYKGAIQALKEVDELLGLKVQRVESEQTIIYQSAVPEPDPLPTEESAADDELTE